MVRARNEKISELSVDAIFALARIAAVRFDLAVERTPFLTGQDLINATFGIGLV